MDSISTFGSDSDDDGPEDDWETRARRRSVPENEVPGTVPCGRFVTRTDDTAIAIVGLLAYSTGLRITVEIRTRHAPDVDDRAMFGAPRGMRGPGDGLLLGAQFADGRRGSTLDGRGDWDVSDSEPCLEQGDGSWGGRTATLGYFLSPYPPPGDLLLVAAWPDAEVPEARFVVPAEALATARDQVIELWPWEPEPEVGGYDEFHSPAIPAGSWFEEDDESAP